MWLASGLLLQVACLSLADLTPALSQGRVIILRHALPLAPGGGDPANFDLHDCRTQRLLGGGGREQAERLGADLRHLNVSRVLSSPWCRCLETAKLMDVGVVESVMFLGSFYDSPPKGVPREEAMAALRHYLAKRSTNARHNSCL